MMFLCAQHSLMPVPTNISYPSAESYLPEVWMAFSPLPNLVTYKMERQKRKGVNFIVL